LARRIIENVFDVEKMLRNVRSLDIKCILSLINKHSSSRDEAARLTRRTCWGTRPAQVWGARSGWHEQDVQTAATNTREQVSNRSQQSGDSTADRGAREFSIKSRHWHCVYHNRHCDILPSARAAQPYCSA